MTDSNASATNLQFRIKFKRVIYKYYCLVFLEYFLVISDNPFALSPFVFKLGPKVFGSSGQNAFVRFEQATFYLEHQIGILTEFEQPLHEHLVLVHFGVLGDFEIAQNCSYLIGQRAILTSFAVERVRFAFGTVQ